MASSQSVLDHSEVTESEPLLQQPRDKNAQHAQQNSVPVHIARRLYVSHFLSTWNSRVFEFGAVLYLATIFPGTLLPMSLYAFARGLSAIIFAPGIGQYIDIGNRLHVVRVSIGTFSHFLYSLSTNSVAKRYSDSSWQLPALSSTSSPTKFH